MLKIFIIGKAVVKYYPMGLENITLTQLWISVSYGICLVALAAGLLILDKVRN